jgi:hypothetical protein
MRVSADGHLPRLTWLRQTILAFAVRRLFSVLEITYANLV